MECHRGKKTRKNIFLAIKISGENVMSVECEVSFYSYEHNLLLFIAKIKNTSVA